MTQSKATVPRRNASEADVRGEQRDAVHVTEVKITPKVFIRTPAQELINPPSFPRLREAGKVG